jgi:hypothetical protein
MIFDETLFISATRQCKVCWPLQEILEHYATIRDAVAGTPHVESHDLPSLVANTSLIYAFNTFKAISLLLHQMYHESGAVVLRQLWEVSLNLHWIAEDPVLRAKDFCGFTLIEHRKLITKSGDFQTLDDFDAATKEFQEKYRYNDKRGRNRIQNNFAAANIYDRAIGLDEPWSSEYKFIYDLASMHAHGAPGAILHGMFLSKYPDSDKRENEAAALVAIQAIKLMVRDVQLLVRLNIIVDAGAVLSAYGEFQETISKTLSNKDQ